MPERPTNPQDEEWRDIHLEDIVRGAGALINFVSGVAAQVNSAVNQSRTPAARPLNAAASRPVERAASHGGREPLVELFDEGDEIAVVVEWPDGDVAQLAASVEDDILTLACDDAPVAELLLPALVEPAPLRQRARNGIAELRFRRAGGAGRSP